MRVSINDHKKPAYAGRFIPAGIDKTTGKDIEGQNIKLATINLASVQPLSGQEKITALEKGYEADHKLFAFKNDVAWLEGYLGFKGGDVITDFESNEYIVEFVGDYRLTHQLDLKLIEKVILEPFEILDDDGNVINSPDCPDLEPDEPEICGNSGKPCKEKNCIRRP